MQKNCLSYNQRASATSSAVKQIRMNPRIFLFFSLHSSSILGKGNFKLCNHCLHIFSSSRPVQVQLWDPSRDPDSGRPFLYKSLESKIASQNSCDWSRHPHYCTIDFVRKCRKPSPSQTKQNRFFVNAIIRNPHHN